MCGQPLLSLHTGNSQRFLCVRHHTSTRKTSSIPWRSEDLACFGSEIGKVYCTGNQGICTGSQKPWLQASACACQNSRLSSALLAVCEHWCKDLWFGGGKQLGLPPAGAQGKSVPPGAPCSFPSALTLRSCLGAPCQYALGTGVGKVRGVRGTGILLTQELRQLLMALPRRQQKAIPRPAELMDSSRDRYPLNENKVIKYCRCN